MTAQSAAASIAASLSLDAPPVGIAFVDAAPEGVPGVEGEHPSACSFWRLAESQVFYAAADKHFNCPIGTMTMGFAMPEEVQASLGDLVGTMFQVGYLGTGEPANLPAVSGGPAGIVYGPLADMPVDPDVVVMWMTPKQAMYYDEAAGTVQWDAPTPARVYGRPGCAAVAVASRGEQPALSMGCIGMRTFTEIADDRVLVAVPGNRVDALASALEATLESNRTMEAAYRAKAAELTGA